MSMKTSALLGAATCVALVGTASESLAGLVVNLRFADGTLTKDVSEATIGTQYTVDGWMSVTGSSGGSEGFQGAYFGVQSQQLTTNVAGNLTERTTLTPFSASGNSQGTLQSLSHAPYGADAIVDLGGVALNTNTGWMRAYAGTGTFITDGGTSITNGAEFKVASVTFTLDSVNLDAASTTGTTSVTLNPIFPSSLLASTRATWQQDGVNVNAGTAGTGGYSTGSSVSFAVTAIPEPASLAFLGLGAIGLVRRRRRR